MPAIRNYTVYAGDKFEDPITFQYADETRIDLSTAEWRGQIRSSASSDVVLGEWEFDDIDSANGEFVFRIPADVTADLPRSCVYDIEDTVSETTWLKGKIKVTSQVSR